MFFLYMGNYKLIFFYFDEEVILVVDCKSNYYCVLVN